MSTFKTCAIVQTAFCIKGARMTDMDERECGSKARGRIKGVRLQPGGGLFSFGVV